MYVVHITIGEETSAASQNRPNNLPKGLLVNRRRIDNVLGDHILVLFLLLAAPLLGLFLIVILLLLTITLLGGLGDVFGCDVAIIPSFLDALLVFVVELIETIELVSVVE